MRVVTDAGAVAALAESPEVAAVSMMLAQVGTVGAQRRARVDTGAMRASIHAEPIGGGGARWGSSIGHMIFNEYGTVKMSAQPMVRPSVDDLRGVL